MKLLSEATKIRFKKIDARSIKNHIVRLKTKIRPDGIDYTTLEILRVRENDNNYYSPTSYSASRLPDRFFEKRRIKEHLYYFPLTDSNVTLLYDVWPLGQIKADKLSLLRIQKILALTIRQELNAKVIADFKSKGELPSLNGTVENSKFPLINFQKVARHCAVNSGSMALFMEQGTGKTATAISAVVNHVIKNNIEHARVVIVCPKAVRTNWEEELEKFVPFDMTHKTTIVRGTKINREKLILQGLAHSPAKERISFVICSYGSLRQTQEAFCLKKLAGLEFNGELKWDWAILDESHYIKSQKAQRTKSAHELRDSCNNRMILTGTPYVNSLFDLWSQWEFLGKYYSGFSNFNAFREFHAKYDRDPETKRRTLVDFENIPLLKERLVRTSYIISKKEALPDLPEKTYDIVECEMSLEQINFYNKVCNQIYLEIENEIDPNQPKEMTVNNVLTKLLRLSQITAGFKVFDKKYDDLGEELENSGIIDRFDPNLKLDKLIDLIKVDLQWNESDKVAESNSKVIVWSKWIASIKQIRARLELEGIKCVPYHGGMRDDARDAAKNDFNKDADTRVFVGNPDAGGVGLNLLGYDPNEPDEYKTNCDHMIYYSQGWSLAARLQSSARSHRKGTRVPVRITDLIVPNSIDMEIKKRVDGKEEVATDLTDVKEILDRLHKPLVID